MRTYKYKGHLIVPVTYKEDGKLSHYWKVVNPLPGIGDLELANTVDDCKIAINYRLNRIENY